MSGGNIQNDTFNVITDSHWIAPCVDADPTCCYPFAESEEKFTLSFIALIKTHQTSINLRQSVSIAHDLKALNSCLKMSLGHV